jgi:hypothetical protein
LLEQARTQKVRFKNVRKRVAISRIRDSSTAESVCKVDLVVRRRTYRFTLRDRFIEITNKSVYPPQEKNPKGEIHEDIGFVSYDAQAKKFMLRQFHVEGFVNQFALESLDEQQRTLVFVSTAIENISPGWRAKETYHFLNNDEFIESFALAQPGKDFATYSETRFHRKPSD